MSLSIEAEFRRRVLANPGIGLLLAQWEYDQKLLQRALTTVGRIFPHYSLHDATHSETILERIAAMLGSDRLSKVTGTDLWLLLESAYLHDVGMIANSVRQSSDINSAEFRQYLTRACASDDADLAQAARRLREELPRRTVSEILEANADVILVYSEYVRLRHPQRSAEFIQDPIQHLSVASPRTPLLPKRFWHCLGQICRAHGETLEFALALPKEESGMGGEFCHPRFVACMLRLGDLLDLDSGRFCSALNATTPRMPAKSLTHRRKHDGVRHFLVSPERISVEAVYGDDIDGYLEAEAWFSWLREELQGQLLAWDAIAPFAGFGALPSVGKIEAKLEGQIIFDPRTRPRFEVDRDKVLDLVRGANLYDGPQDAVREVIQNAIDATLLRLSFELQCRGSSTPTNPGELRTALQAYLIDVTIEKAEQQPSDASRVRWSLRLRDLGIGLRKQDMRYLLCLGSSGRNQDRSELVNYLPSWARPSGTFGIGFHSLFEHCRVVGIESRHPTDSVGICATFEKHRDANEHAVVVKERSQSQYPTPPGTTLTAEFEFLAVPDSVSWGLGRSEARRVCE